MQKRQVESEKRQGKVRENGIKSLRKSDVLLTQPKERLSLYS